MNFFDEFCRSLAEPMPRRRAWKIMAGGLAGLVLAPFAFGQKACKSGETACSGYKSGCCPAGSQCWGGQVCCNTGEVGFICKNKNGSGAGQAVCVPAAASGSQPNTCTKLTPGNA